MVTRIFKSDQFKESLPDLMRSGQSAVFQDLPFLDGELSISIEDFRKRFGHVEIPVHEDFGYLMNRYLDTLTGGQSVRSTIRALIDGECDHWFPSQSAVCSYQKLPDAIQRRLNFLPGLEEIDGNPIYKIFYAKEGTRTLLHFDQDHRHVLLRQVCGRKRGVMIEPCHHEYLLPIGHNSTLNLSLLKDQEKDRLYRSVSAEVVDLGPGDLLYIPPLTWHYVEYLSAGFSIGHRFCQKPINRFLSENLHQTGRLQNIAVRYLDEKNVSKEEMEYFVELQNLFSKPFATGFEKYFALNALIEDIYSRMFGQSRFLAIGIQELEQTGFLRLIKAGRLYSV